MGAFIYWSSIALRSGNLILWQLSNLEILGVSKMLEILEILKDAGDFGRCLKGEKSRKIN